MGKHLDEDQIAGLAGLGSNDDTMREAAAHADRCETCAASVSDARRTLAFLDAPVPGASDAHALGRRAYERAVRDEARSASRARALLAASVATVLLLALTRLIGVEALIPSAGDHPIWRCALTEMVGGALGLAGVIYGARRRFVTLASLQGAACGAGGAALAGTWVQMRCPEHDLLHLAVAHVGMVVVAAMIGAQFAPRATGVLR